ncbi:recombinase RecT [Lacrimispora xylanolytica]|uniref:Recombinase RecT n=1 Tax=Lacrimispora xylanolytica TaxID=29375 RepID=A0ABY7AER8_9FIRM|nr:recombinase RecT [Lacrimispora xylanolytica]WAJ24027.1 recombinase RecT [Lacrimispora xylanolytica]
MGNEITTQQKTGIATFLGNDKVRANIMQVVGQKNTTRFIASVVSAVQNTPALQECSNNSILSAALLGEALNLSPSPQLGQIYMVPYKKKDREGNVISVDAQFQLGAKGYKQLAMRTGQYLDLDVVLVRQGEYLGRDRLTGKHKFEFIEDDAIREELPVIGYLAYFELLNGFRKQIYWTRTKMEKHADQYSQAFNLNEVKSKNSKYDRVSYEDFLAGKYPEKDSWKYSSFWYKSFDEMAEKTMIRQLISKWGIMSIEMSDAYERDMAVINEDGSPRYIDNETINQHESNLSQANTVDFEEVPETVSEAVSNEVVQQTGGDPF